MGPYSSVAVFIYNYCVVLLGLSQAAEFEGLAAAHAGDGRGFPHVVGAVDGTHIPIKNPPHAGDEYLNRKGSYSILAQATCNANLEFIDVQVGQSGRNHDAWVFQCSRLGEQLADPSSPLASLLACELTNLAGLAVPMVLLGDSAYGNGPFMLTPFTQSEADRSREKRNYNWKHALTRNVIERAFGLLKQRFRVLLKQIDLELSNTVYVVLACCVLHNLCIQRELDAPPADEEYQQLLAEYRQMYPASGSAEVGSAGAGRGRRGARGGRVGNAAQVPAVPRTARDAVVAHLSAPWVAVGPQA